MLARNPVHSALFFLVTLVRFALFLQQDAALVAAIQIVVYAEPIVVLFLFVITLLGVDKHEPFEERARSSGSPRSSLGALLLPHLVLAGNHWATGAHSTCACSVSTTPATSRRSRRACSPISSGRSR